MATEIYLGLPPENIVNWIKNTERLKKPLCFTAEEAGSTIKMFKNSSAPTVYLETSTTSEEGSWTDFTVCTFNNDTFEANDDGTIITLTNIGDKVYFRAKQDNWQFANNVNEVNQFVMTGKIAASGNINTLLKADGSVLDLTGRDCCYYNMFSGCTSLTQAPELPATTLVNYCYSGMFSNCTSLTQAPALPVTTLANGCYNSMFLGCTSLTQAPELPATTLVDSCYSGMFRRCTSLTQAPALPATTLADYCYNSMFEGCTSLTQTPELPVTTLAKWCYQSMFKSCTSLTQAPELPATTLADSCYNSMFYGCTSLAQAPYLPATTLANRCYQSMFQSCKSPITFLDKTFDEVVDLIQKQILIGYQWNDNKGSMVNLVEIICSDKTMLASYNKNKRTWTLTEKQ